jgi:hypothetical protein
MNPSILFETDYSEYQMMQVKPEMLAAHIGDAPAFNKLIQALCNELGHDVMNGGFKALPLGDELSGRWRCGSPMGQEYTTPPAAWCYDERIKLATTLETHPLMVLPADGKKKKELIALVETVLGAGAVVNVKKHKEQTALDDALDNMWGDGGGTC